MGALKGDTWAVDLDAEASSELVGSPTATEFLNGVPQFAYAVSNGVLQQIIPFQLVQNSGSNTASILAAPQAASVTAAGTCTASLSHACDAAALPSATTCLITAIYGCCVFTPGSVLYATCAASVT